VQGRFIFSLQRNTLGVMVMKILKSSLTAMAFALLTISASSTAQSNPTVNGQTASAANNTPVPISVWAQRDSVSSVETSPDGKHLLILKREGGNFGENVLEIYKTDDLTKPLRRLNSKPMEMTAATWISDKHIYGRAEQVKRSKVAFPEDDIRSYKTFSYNLEKNKFAKSDGSFGIAGLLPKEPGFLIVSEGNPNASAGGDDPFAAFRPRAYYKYNLDTGARTLIFKGNEKNATAGFDLDGNPRFSQGFDAGKQVFYYRAVGDTSWKEMEERVDYNKKENLYKVLGGFFGFAGISSEDPNKGYFIDNRGEDKAGLYEFDFKTGKIGNKIYSNSNADVMGVVRHSMSSAGNNKVVAAVYPGAKYERHWFDMEEKALYEALEKKIQHAHQISIDSRSRDGKTMIARNEGPKDPGSFWLVKDGKMAKLASTNPLLKSSDLNEVEFIKYPARDGRMIPAYVTKPKGKGPFPLIVMPHGGPAVNEVVAYDEWGQFLANNGYMVLYPQYRITTGWGKDHFDSSWGQHGLAMQDDKDDGALYLAKQGLVDKNRMAMFGWSYGGYAALVASQRENNIYQCAIAGAAVADTEKQYLGRRNPYDPKPIDEWSKQRGTSIGINPIKDAAKTNIPLLMIHGDMDMRVMYYHMKDHKEALEKAGKTNVKYVTLKGANHFSNTLMYDHQELLYTTMLDYIKKDCGPGGL
jgi:dipeptidyl aminopeptidase/acylaminoacyl peptidase